LYTIGDEKHKKNNIIETLLNKQLEFCW